MRSPRTAMKSSPRAPQLEKARAQLRRPNAAKKKKKNKNVIYKIISFQTPQYHVDSSEITLMWTMNIAGPSEELAELSPVWSPAWIWCRASRWEASVQGGLSQGGAGGDSKLSPQGLAWTPDALWNRSQTPSLGNTHRLKILLKPPVVYYRSIPSITHYEVLFINFIII